jgi:hypothetical protein
MYPGAFNGRSREQRDCAVGRGGVSSALSACGGVTGLGGRSAGSTGRGPCRIKAEQIVAVLEKWKAKSRGMEKKLDEEVERNNLKACENSEIISQLKEEVKRWKSEALSARDQKEKVRKTYDLRARVIGGSRGSYELQILISQLPQ